MLTRHIRESLQVTPGPFPDFWSGDEANNEGPFTHLEPVNDRPTERRGAAGDTSLGPPNLF